MLTKRKLLETAALATVAAGTTLQPLLAQERVAKTAAAAGSSDDIRIRDAQSEEEWYYSVGTQNYVFTLPLTMLERSGRYGSIRLRSKRQRNLRPRRQSIRSAT